MTWLGDDLPLGLGTPVQPSHHPPAAVYGDENQQTPPVVDLETRQEIPAPRDVNRPYEKTRVTEVTTQSQTPAAKPVNKPYQTRLSKRIRQPYGTCICRLCHTPGDMGVVRKQQKLVTKKSNGISSTLDVEEVERRYRNPAPKKVIGKSQKPAAKNVDGDCHTKVIDVDNKKKLLTKDKEKKRKSPNGSVEMCQKSVVKVGTSNKNEQVVRKTESSVKKAVIEEVEKQHKSVIQVFKEYQKSLLMELRNNQKSAAKILEVYQKSAVEELQKYHRTAVEEVIKQELSVDDIEVEHEMIVVKDIEDHKPSVECCQDSPVKPVEPLPSLEKMVSEQTSPARDKESLRDPTLKSVAIQTSVKDVKESCPKPPMTIDVDKRLLPQPAAKGVDRLRQKPVVVLVDIFSHHKVQPTFENGWWHELAVDVGRSSLKPAATYVKGQQTVNVVFLIFFFFLVVDCQLIRSNCSRCQ